LDNQQICSIIPIEEEVLNGSIENLEFEFASTILKLTTKVKDKIAIVEGHGELNGKNFPELRPITQPPCPPSLSSPPPRPPPQPPWISVHFGRE
jgi:hypothetical protein